MPGKPAARATDLHTCTLPLEGGPPGSIHVGGVITVAGARKVFIDGLMAAVLNDTCVCPGNPNSIKQGSSKVNINQLPAARKGDVTAHGGMIQGGSSKVFIAD